MKLYRQKKTSGPGIRKRKHPDHISLKEISRYQECPEDLEGLMDKVSLEDLIYWKLSRVFHNVDRDIPHDILKTIITHVERPLYSLILLKTQGNQSVASEILGCNRNTLRRRLRSFFSVPDYKLREVMKNLEPEEKINEAEVI